MDHHQRGAEASPSLSALFKTICPLVKDLDERRSRAGCLRDLFSEEVSALRRDIVQNCEDAFFDDQDCVSPKPREIMWRKGYYDTISMAKRFIHKHNRSVTALEGSVKSQPDGIDELCLFIEEGMLRLKRIIVRIEKDYDLDLKYIIDFSLFEDDPEQVDKVAAEEEDHSVNINKKITSLEIISFALESIHALIVSLGDMHRYYLDFGLNQQFNRQITKPLTARYYEAAFQLNPKNGMPQNQLATLWIGKNYNLDSVYHYLYSLVSPKPFELSEDNVGKIFHQSVAYLNALVVDKDYHVSMRDFVARFLLIVDIFFFDKNVPIFNDLCRFLLCDLNTMLMEKDELTGEPILDKDVLFKFTLILFFCMQNLKVTNSTKVYQLNAFLAAICDQFVESCNRNFNEFFEEHAEENEEYQRKYQQMFEEYLSEKTRQNSNGEVVDLKKKDKGPVNGHQRIVPIGGLSGTSSTATDEMISQEVLDLGRLSRNGKTPLTGESSGGGQGDHGGERRLRNKNGLSAGSGAPGTANGGGGGKKRVMKYRRRRRRSTYTSDSDLTSNFDSDSSNSDGDDEEEEDELAFRDEEDESDFSDDADQNQEEVDNIESDGSDVVIEEETMVIVDNGKIQKPMEQSKKNLEDQLKTLNIHDDQENEYDREDATRKERNRQKVALVKYSPNLLLRFVDKEPTLMALKVLFDWLMDNKEIILECFQSNPEFVHKMMNLLNTVNVNIFTRRVYFDRKLLTVDGIREDILSLFEARAKLPIQEDMQLKHFVEFSKAQGHLDWELSAQMGVTRMEENLLRVVKLKNFGFFICDRKKFGYSFRNCRFEEVDMVDPGKGKRGKNGKKEKGKASNAVLGGGWGSQGSGSGENRRERRRRHRKKNGIEIIGDMEGNSKNGGGGGNRRQRQGKRNGQRGMTGGGRYDDGEEEEMQRPRERRRMEVGGGTGDQENRKKQNDAASREKEMLKKGELMGKLWLRNEVKNLESKAKPRGMNALLTPYVVVDLKALVMHLAIVKHFVSMEKFIVLIPAEVLAELDSLKVTHDRARECIRWLDRTISNGSPFLKTQEPQQKIPLRDFVKPRHGIRTDVSSFIEIAEFCQFLTKKHEIDGHPADVLTLLTGEDLAEKEPTPECDYVKILRSIPIKFDRIDKFYGKLIKK